MQEILDKTDVDQLITSQNETLQKYMDASLSFNSKVNYMSDIRQFQRWGGNLPSSVGEILSYVLYAAKIYNPNTIRRRVNTLRSWHKMNNHPDPTSDKKVQMLLKGIRNTHGTRTKQAKAFTKDDIFKIHTELSKIDKPLAYRNNALIQIGFYGAFRRSELVEIKLEDLSLTDDGLEILVRRSKTDQESKGEIIAIPYFTNSVPCPVITLFKWLEYASITSGYVFRSFTQGRMMEAYAINAQEVSMIIKRLVKKYLIGDPHEYSGHSLRRGFATTATYYGAPLASIMKQGRWRSVNTVMKYMDDSNRFQGNAASLIDNGAILDKP